MEKKCDPGVPGRCRLDPSLSFQQGIVPAGFCVLRLAKSNQKACLYRRCARHGSFLTLQPLQGRPNPAGARSDVGSSRARPYRSQGSSVPAPAKAADGLHN